METPIEQLQQMKNPEEMPQMVPSETMPPNFPVTNNGQTFRGLEFFSLGFPFEVYIFVFAILALMVFLAPRLLKSVHSLVEPGEQLNPTGTAVVSIFGTIVFIALNYVDMRIRGSY
jgi:hypothetical protein